MKHILVHLHIYYHDQTDYFIRKLSNISGCSWDLCVTMAEKNAETIRKISLFKSDTKFIITENIGYDIWPFIKVMKTADLDSYDYIIKLHSKGKSHMKTHGIRLDGYGWRNALVDSLLGNRKKFLDGMDAFSDQDIGIVSCDLLWLKTVEWTGEDNELLGKELERIGMSVTDRHFCVGSIFMARAGVFRFLKDSRISQEMFPLEMHSHSGGSMAHVYERIISMAPSAYGYKAWTASPGTAVAIYMKFNRIISPLLKNFLSIDREGVTGTKCITFLGMKLRLGKLRETATE